MLSLLRELIRHKNFANAALLDAMRRQQHTADDPELRRLLEHIRVSNRFWLLAVSGRTFDLDQESRASPSLDELTDRFREIQREEDAWLARATAHDTARILEGPLIPNGRCTVADALLQVALHSHGHRTQCAMLLRQAGGEPPVTDYIVWVGDEK